MPRKRKDDRPDGRDWEVDKIEELVAELERYWRQRKDDDERRLALYRGVNPTEVKTSSDDRVVDPLVVKSKRARRAIDLYTSLLATPPQYGIDAYGVGQGAQRSAERAERWLNVVARTVGAECGEDTVYQLTQEALIYGYSAVKVLPYPAAWQDYPERVGDEDDASYVERERAYRADAPLPIVAWHVPALTWYPLLEGRRVIKSVEVREVPLAWVRSRYPDVEIGSGRPTERVKLVEVLDSEWAGYYVMSGQLRLPLRFWRHGMEADGAPVALYEGLRSADADLRWRWAGVLDAVSNPTAGPGGAQGLLELEDMLLSRLATQVRIHYDETVILELSQSYSPQALAEAMRTRRFKIGGTNIVFRGPDGSGERYVRWEPPSNLPDATLLHELISRELVHLLPPVLMGQSPAGDAGYKVNLDVLNAERKLSVIADSLARGDVQTAQLYLRAVRAFGRSVAGPERGDSYQVYVRETRGEGTRPIAISWDDVRAYMRLIRATRKTELPIDRLAQADAMIKFLSGPIAAPRRWVFEEIGRIENPQELDDERMIEEFARNPLVRKHDEELVLRELGLLRDKDEGMPPEEAAQLAAEGELPPGMGPALEAFGAPPTGGEAELGPVAPQAAAPPPPVRSGRAGQARQPLRLPLPEGPGGRA